MTPPAAVQTRQRRGARASAQGPRSCTLETERLTGQVVYHIFLDRPFSFMYLAKVDDTKEFAVQEVPDKELEHSAFLPQDAQLHMHILTLKP